MIFQFFLFNNFGKFSQISFFLCHYWIRSVDWCNFSFLIGLQHDKMWKNYSRFLNTFQKHCIMSYDNFSFHSVFCSPPLVTCLVGLKHKLNRDGPFIGSSCRDLRDSTTCAILTWTFTSQCPPSPSLWNGPQYIENKSIIDYHIQILFSSYFAVVT